MCTDAISVFAKFNNYAVKISLYSYSYIATRIVLVAIIQNVSYRIFGRGLSCGHKATVKGRVREGKLRRKGAK